MDKGWMRKNRLSREYEAGVDSFLTFAIQNARDPELMSCPCAKCEFCSDYLFNVHTIGIPSKNLDRYPSKPLSQPRVQTISNDEWEQAHLCVLNNDSEIDPYIKEHKRHLKKIFSDKHKSEKWLKDEHNRTFISWLRERVAATITSCSKNQVSERLKWMTHGPSTQVVKYDGYLLDGVTFHTKARDDLRTAQNSGVSVVARTIQVSSAKDKNPIESNMKYYGIIDEIWAFDYQIFQVIMFKCTWVDDNNGVEHDDLGYTLVNLKKVGYKTDSFILGSHATQVFYVEDPEDPEKSVVLTSPSKEYTEYINDDELGEISIHHPCFSKGLPIMNVTDVVDEIEPPCIRDDCDGIWVDI
ncbi:hypothetical protein C2S52_000923 [Perilla frutescens var. hirtella]|nr:hypothetical protein C2S52_000923 [Perilla frutescens var. hirtella]